MLAWRMASHLEAQGERVAFLGLVDPYLPPARQTNASHTSAAADDWRKTLKVVLARISSTAPSAAALRRIERDPFTSQQALAQVLLKLFSESSDHLRREYSGMTSSDLAGVILARIALDRLEREHVASPVRLSVDPYCWWAAGQSARARTRLAHWAGAGRIHHTATYATHEAILSCEEFLESITGLTV
jgi:thioesterase domain-containing protein